MKLALLLILLATTAFSSPFIHRPSQATPSPTVEVEKLTDVIKRNRETAQPITTASTSISSREPCASSNCGNLCTSISRKPFGSSKVAVEPTSAGCVYIPTLKGSVFTTLNVFEGSLVAFPTSTVSVPTIRGRGLPISLVIPSNKTLLDNSPAKRELRGVNQSLVSTYDNSLAKRAFPTIPNNDVGAYLRSVQPNFLTVVSPTTDGDFFNFDEEHVGTAGVQNLYGCTAVFIASSLGVYISHIYERPVFINNVNNRRYETDDESFWGMSYREIFEGSPGAYSVADLIGTDEKPGKLHPSHEPVVYVITPLSDQWDRIFDDVTTTLRYERHANQLAQGLINSIYNNGEPDGMGPAMVIGYTRYTRTEVSMNSGGYEGKVVLEVDPMNHVEEQPDGTKRQMGSYRIFVQDRVVLEKNFQNSHKTPTPCRSPTPTPTPISETDCDE
ncbi:hypothetical protein BGW36DRAFT_364350 [Talaromyces proteolyticus]|uniref:Uncharacterized protein n=1 Tax=Talaromyces proteolyticus TaxID=1131652 RepID=A0AAD4PV26_9EURO|nr:uncharacterized protein BGW36DRAFT_364350 [Talaromyces proteolyticus]KAH8690789.1 hypothetical protein BGW36DRAFT_364350 [Talaromyces proteolyticus]